MKIRVVGWVIILNDPMRSFKIDKNTWQSNMKL